MHAKAEVDGNSPIVVPEDEERRGLGDGLDLLGNVDLGEAARAGGGFVLLAVVLGGRLVVLGLDLCLGLLVQRAQVVALLAVQHHRQAVSRQRQCVRFAV